jgi:hypothetical protein
MKMQPIYFLKSIKISHQGFSMPTAVLVTIHQKLWSKLLSLRPYQTSLQKGAFYNRRTDERKRQVAERLVKFNLRSKLEVSWN